MDIKLITESNREAWNEALSYHQKARKNTLKEGFKRSDFTLFNRDCDDVLIDKINEICLEGKVIAQLPCNNGRELLSLMRHGAKEAIGFDISDTAIKEAQELAEISGLNAKFYRTDILDIGPEFDDFFDFIYVSEGSLQWFPSLDDYFSIVSRLLKKDGRILIYEMHPFAYFFEQIYGAKDVITVNDFIPYFEKGPYSYENGLDYVGGVAYKAKKCYWFMHKMSDIINAILKNNVELIEFNEYGNEMANNSNTKQLDKFPLSYIIVGTKK